MIRILSKNTINKFIVAYLSKAKRGFVSKVPLWEIVNAILYKLKTGIQWSLLPIKSLINRRKLSCGAIYHHYRKWTKGGSWQYAFEQLLSKHKAHLGLSLAFLDATHTIAKRGGDQTGTCGKRRFKSSNTLWLTDRQGLVVAFCPPLSGKRHDAFNIAKRFQTLLDSFYQAQIAVKGLWLNVDKGFECEALRRVCIQNHIELNAPHNRRKALGIEDELPYSINLCMMKDLSLSEPMPGRLPAEGRDNYRSFGLRFDKTIQSWYAWHYIFCIIQWINKILKV